MTAPGTQGKVSPESMGKTASSAVGSPPDAKPASPRTPGNYAEQNRLKPCRGKPFDLWKELKFESQKGNSRSNLRGGVFCFYYTDPKLWIWSHASRYSEINI